MINRSFICRSQNIFKWALSYRHNTEQSCYYLHHRYSSELSNVKENEVFKY